MQAEAQQALITCALPADFPDGETAGACIDVEQDSDSGNGEDRDHLSEPTSAEAATFDSQDVRPVSEAPGGSEN